MEPVDLHHLAKQTAGDAKLEREVLTIFLDEAATQMEKVRSAVRDERRLAAHRLVGSAKAIGAGEVALHAAAIEAGGTNIATLDAAVEKARRFVIRHLSGA